MYHARTLLAAALLATLCSSCEERHYGSIDHSAVNNWVGKYVRIQFRRDALGSAHSLPVSPTTSSINGANTSIHGKLVSIEPNAVLIESTGKVYWIPREVILLIDADKSVIGR